MSQKTYSAKEVAQAVLKKCQDMVELKKSLFNDGKSLKCEASAPEKNKESCFWEIKWSVEKIKALKELSWTVESEAPEAKELFEKEFKKEKARLSDLIAEHKKLKKSEDESEDEKNLLAKAEEMDKCGDMAKPMGKSDKLKNFLAKKNKKKDLKKMNGVTPPAPSAPSIATQIGWPGSGKSEVKKARVDEGKTDNQKQVARAGRNSRVKFKAGSPEGQHPDTGEKVRPRKPGEGDKIIGIPKPKKPDMKAGTKMNKAADGQAPTSKAIGLKPLSTGAEAPKVDNASKPPKAATTLKSFLAQKKK